MPTDYKALAELNRLDYGRKIDRIGRKIIAGLYSERTHFVFELLQNAEDAIRKRQSEGPRSVRFELSHEGLKFSHFGKPFDEPDIRGICGIDESTKAEDLTAIGRFGIGFKSVFAFTDRPEIRSGQECFAIESFVLPVAIPDIERVTGETVFWLPFGEGREDAFDEIAQFLEGLSARTLMFLREILEVSWSVQDGASGTCSRKEERLSDNARRILLIETNLDCDTREESWLVFTKPAKHDEAMVGAVELAFAVASDESTGAQVIRPTDGSRLAAFFPTNVEARLGFLLQAPFRTTPARDNIPPKDPWNKHLLLEAGKLLFEALESLRDMGLLSVEALKAMPLDREDFLGTMLEPLFNAVQEALMERPLLPTNGELRVTARRSALARGEGLRELVSSRQLGVLFASGERLHWLTEEITAIRAPVLRNYLMKELGVREVTPESFLSRVTKEFLESQSDEWIRRLYGFLSVQKKLMGEESIRNKAWVRLQDGRHVPAYSGSQPLAFLPSKAGKSGFPTVKAEVCRSESARDFLKDLKLSEPDPVDDVIKNVLPRYSETGQEPAESEQYVQDLALIVTAFSTQRMDQRSKLVSALKQCRWVASRTNGGTRSWRKAATCYLATERLTRLFTGVPEIPFVDNTLRGLQGEAVREVLVACGAARYLETFAIKEELTDQEKSVLRKASGDERRTYSMQGEDRGVRGLRALLSHISTLPYSEAQERARILWDALVDLVQDKRPAVLRATYSWFYRERRGADYDASFVRDLKSAPWVPLGGVLVRPTDAIFEHIEPKWPQNASLQSVLGFKPPLIELLAKEIGLDRDFLLAMANASPVLRERALNLLRGEAESESEQEDASAPSGMPSNESSAVASRQSAAGVSQNDKRTSASSGVAGKARASDKGSKIARGRCRFISYLAADPSEEPEDDLSDSSTQEERMRVEAVAIEHILSLEPSLFKTPTCNPGFDLYGTDSLGKTNRWIEVKGMVGTLENHPVGLSKMQFEMAQEKGTRYWLYIVEQAKSTRPRLVRIQDPAGNARTFTFDMGWRDVAEIIQIDVETGEIVDESAEPSVSDQ